MEPWDISVLKLDKCIMISFMANESEIKIEPFAPDICINTCIHMYPLDRQCLDMHYHFI